MGLTVSKWNVAQCLVPLLVVLIARQGFAQDQEPVSQLGDKAFQSIFTYLKEVDDNIDCEPARALVAARRAVDAAAKAHVSKASLTDALGDLKAKSSVRENDVNKRIAELDVARKEVPGLIKQARLETASTRLQTVDSKGCYSKLNPTRLQLETQRTSARNLVEKADELMATNATRPYKDYDTAVQAVHNYQTARQIDEEFPGLDGKLTLALEAQSNTPKPTPVKDALGATAKGTGHAAKKALPWVIGIGAVGFLVYYLKKQPCHSLVCSNP